MTKEETVPSASNLTNVKLSGYLDKYFPKSWLPWHTWRRRFCVLVGTKIFYYESEVSKGSDKSSGVINLEYYDVCCQDEKEKKKGNGFLLYSSNSPESIDLKHTFVADTSAEMNKWIDSIRNAIRETKLSRSKSGSKRKAQRTKSGASGGNSGDHTSGPESGNSQDEEANLDLTLSSLTTEATLRNATKERAKGPPGRRLPHRKSAQPQGSLKESERKVKSNSMASGFPQAISGIPEEEEEEEGEEDGGEEEEQGEDNNNSRSKKKESKIGGGVGNTGNTGKRRINEVNGSQHYNNNGNYHQQSNSDGDDLSKDSIESDADTGSKTATDEVKNINSRSKKPIVNHSSKPMSPLIQELQKRYASAELKERQANNNNCSETDSASFSPRQENNNGSNQMEEDRPRNRNVKDINSFLGELKSNITEIEIQLYSVKRDFSEKFKENNKMMEEMSQGLKKVDTLVSQTSILLKDAENAREEYLKLKTECSLLLETLKDAHQQNLKRRSSTQDED